MEILNYKKCLGLTAIICIAFSFSLGACDSAEEPIEDVENANKTINETNKEIIKLSNGEIIVLSDTTTHIVDTTEFDDINVIRDKASENLFAPKSRAGAVLRAYGFDSQSPETDWKKWALKGFEQFGIPQGTYIARFVRVHKELSVEPETHVSPADYNVENAPKDVMGWSGTTWVIGFTATNISDNIANGETRILFIKSDLAGRTYNKTIPADPSNLLWVYTLEPNIDVWG